LRARRGAAVDWLIVGLGNPGREHADTRHNVGFGVAQELVERWSLGAPKERFRGRIAEGSVGGSGGAEHEQRRQRVAVLCPLTYMNDAGRSVGPARGALRVALERVVVVHDEIDLPFGEVRTRTGGGLAGHNGLKSVARALGGPGFTRVRVGVGRPDTTDPEVVSSYVLGRFRERQEEVLTLIARACDEVEALVFGDG
jgi:PTH1 family peptidyl-tRNA hydrolase